MIKHLQEVWRNRTPGWAANTWLTILLTCFAGLLFFLCLVAGYLLIINAPFITLGIVIAILVAIYINLRWDLS